MSLLRRFIARLRAKPPVIMTEWGPVTEAARRRAAENMYEDPALRAQVEDLIIKQMGGDRVRGFEECRRRYPEAYR